LGAPFYDKDLYEGNDIAGVVTGLAWTSVGGDILFIESSLSPGNGKLTLTGSLGDVMKESVTIALAYLRAHAGAFDINPKLFEQWDVHVHVPAGATPKDGPSAGVTMLTALVTSAFTQRKLKPHLAMTGEITLARPRIAGGWYQGKDTGCQTRQYQGYHPLQIEPERYPRNKGRLHQGFEIPLRNRYEGSS
jgi:ATP-dependent Lon protease